MNLLHFGLFDNKEPQMGLRSALRKLPERYNEFSWTQRPKMAVAYLEQLIKKYKPDTVFMQMNGADIIPASVIAKYSTIRFFNFNGDVRPEIPKWHFDIAPYCTNLFTNTEWVEKVPGSKYMQISCDLNIYKPEGKRLITNPVVFMGNNHGSKFELSLLRQDMIELFSDQQYFQVYGNGWGKGVINLNYKQQDEASVYRGSKIGINLSHMDLSSYTSDRMFRLMACGTMCLAYRHKDIHKEFIEGLHLRTWKTLDELKHLVTYYLENDSARLNIACNGCDLVHQKYNWTERLKPIICG